MITGSELMGREITNIRSCDMVVIARGRTGTLGELAIAYDEGRLIGVLTETGGITELVESIIKASGRQDRPGRASSTTTIESGSSIG